MAGDKHGDLSRATQPGVRKRNEFLGAVAGGVCGVAIGAVVTLPLIHFAQTGAQDNSSSALIWFSLALAIYVACFVGGIMLAGSIVRRIANRNNETQSNNP